MKYTLAILCALSITGLTHAADLSSGDKQFLTGYEKIRVALASDDLDAAKKAAAGLPAASDIAGSKDLGAARAAFEKLTPQAEKLSAGQAGYHVYHCSMANKDWVQSATDVGNPFLGKDMAGCGEVKQ